MKIVTPEQMRRIDEKAVNMGVPSLLLMEDAASAVVSELPSDAYSFLIVCGTGNNGGDGYAIARLLHTAGKSVYIMSAGLPKTEDALTNYNIAKKIGIPFVTLETAGEYDVIVDALLGTGLSGEVRDAEKHIIEYINSSKSYVCSVDMPSGTDGKSGAICGAAVKADKTVTFCCLKQGQMWAKNIGKLKVKNISIPRQAIDSEKIRYETITGEYVNKLIPKRDSDSHKGSCGKILAVAGSSGMTGAARFCCEAALRSGAGLVKLAVPQSLCLALDSIIPEMLTLPMPESGGALSKEASDLIIKQLKTSNVLLFGCGLSITEGTREVFSDIVTQTDLPMVIDADGLNLLSENTELIKNKNAVLTPHPVEFSRLSGLSLNEINSDRLKAASDFAAEYNVVTLLKGHGTVVALPDGRAFVNTTGNEGMATGGSGDVLAGMIASFMGQGLSAQDAAVAGVYLHGLSGDIAKEYKGIYSMLPSDTINCIGEAIDIVKEVI